MEDLLSQHNTSGLDMTDFVRASLVSIAKAQYAMSSEQTQAILKTCFNYDSATQNHVPVMLNMALTRGFVVPGEKAGDSPTVQQFTSNFNVPLITLMPISSLAIDTVVIDFSMEITSQYAASKNNTDAFTNQTKPTKKVSLLGKITPDTGKNTSGNSSPKEKDNFKIHVEVRPIPLTKGMLSIIDTYSKAIQPSETK